MTLSFAIFSGTNKDYYLSCEIRYKGQNKMLYNKVLIGDNFEEASRKELRAQGISNPSRKSLSQ